MTRKIELSEKKKSWAGKRTIDLKGEPLYYDISSQKQYEREIRKLYKDIEIETKEKIREVFKKYDYPKQRKQETAKAIKALDKKYSKVFNEKSNKIASDMVSKSMRNSSSKLKMSLKKLTGGKVIDTSIMTPRLESTSSKAIRENSKFISDIPSKYLKGIKKSSFNAIDGKGTLKDLNKQFSKRSGQAKRYIKNVSHGEVKKTYNDINFFKMSALGVKTFIWKQTYQAVNPRHQHILLSGKTFHMNDLPVIDEDGNTGKPGDAYNCHCIMLPVIEYKNGKLN